MPDYQPIIDQMKAAYGVRVRRWRRSMSGVATRLRYPDGREEAWIESPYPKTPVSLAIFLHEIGHHAVGFGRFPTRAEEEYRVWVWALSTMRRLGIPPDQRTLRRVDRSMRHAVGKALRRGVKRLPAELTPYLPDTHRRT
ncbi:MAG: hypothetical protein ACK4PI_14100 [Tepidisphaerales bacterium]